MCFSLPPWVSLEGLLLALQIAVLVKVSDFITALIRDRAFNISGLITSRPNTEQISCSLRRGPETRPEDAPEVQLNLKPRGLSHMQGRRYYSTTHRAATFKQLTPVSYSNHVSSNTHRQEIFNRAPSSNSSNLIY